MPPMIMAHDVDPKDELLDRLGNISDEEIRIFQNQVLVAVYIRPKKTKSGILLADQTVDEDRYQGKIGLVVKTGPVAFNDEADKWFKGVKVDVGDWAIFRPSDGWSITVNGVLCRIIDDIDIRGRAAHPDMIW